MTLIIGTVCSDGMFFCSDTEEATDLGNKRVSKIRYVGGDGWQMVLGVAGFGPLCDKAMDWIAEAARREGNAFIPNREKVIEREIKKIYADYIDSVPEYRSSIRPIKAVIGIMDRLTGENYLYSTYEEIIQAISGRKYVCAGCGEGLANYYLDRLFQDYRAPSFSCRVPLIAEAETLLRFVMREAKDSVGAVGGDTDTISLRADGWSSGTFGAGWEGQQPLLRDLLEHFWLHNQKSTPSDSQTSEDQS